MDADSPNPENLTKQTIEGWVDEYGDALLRFAFAKLQNRAAAEDVVQETFIAAYCSFDSFRGESSPMTWLVSILRNKLIDLVRKEQRERNKIDQFFDDKILPKCPWNAGRLSEWSDDPAQGLENEEFWRVFNDCVSKLPEKLLEVYSMREINEIELVQICKILKITSTNVSVRLYRARLALRECLDQNWFQ